LKCWRPFDTFGASDQDSATIFTGWLTGAKQKAM